ncbi:hypothetical protein JCM4814A_81040 [Streptomyces phaeofaciens JCM 4814]|uniref:Uncharacterized protein n=1 Tax=Streptomyces phaeofaciens TaxID=68254 RepID=A0A918HT02_9ACTN|nr:hypothetical protein GCM10010226_90580 [Streptomyces phaeofaciens]
MPPPGGRVGGPIGRVAGYGAGAGAGSCLFDFIGPCARVVAMPQLRHRLRSLTYTLGLVQTRFSACRETSAPAPEHALADDATLCGIPQHQVTAYRHLFVARRRSGRCPDCRMKAVEASSRS